MKDLSLKFSRSVDLVLDSFSGRLCTAKVWLLLNKHRRFLECEKDGGCVEMSISRLVKVYACQLQNQKSYLNGKEGLMEAASACLSEIKCCRLNPLPDTQGLHFVFHLCRRLGNM